MQNHTDPDLVGSAEASRILECHQVTVARLVSSKKLTPAHKLPGKNGAYLFNRADVEKLAVDDAKASA